MFNYVLSPLSSIFCWIKPPAMLGRVFMAMAVLLACGNRAANAANEPVYYYQKDSRYEYYQTLLRKTLEVTEKEYGVAVAQAYRPEEADVTEARGLSLLTQKHIQVAFWSSKPAREERARAVPVALEEGLLGLRLLMIDGESQPEFDRIKTHEQLLKEFLVGFNPLWGDYSIYQYNGFNLLPANKYDVLFKMLASGRFDYFPRGLTEVWRELDRFQPIYPNLRVENKFALYYNYPVYFYVHKDNEVLAQRLQKGLAQLNESGEFARIFQQYFGNNIARANLAQRTIIVLNTPDLTGRYLTAAPSWWPSNKPFPILQAVTP